MSSTISSRSIQFTQSAQSDTNPSILLDGGGISSNYFHKKFKRFASLVNEDIVNCKRCQKQINERTSATNGKDAFCTECRTEISNRKPYKPKFHKATQCQSVNNSNIGHSIQDIIGATNEPKEIKCHSMPQHPAPVNYSYFFLPPKCQPFILISIHFRFSQQNALIILLLKMAIKT